MLGSNPQTMRSWPELKSDTYLTEPPRRPLFVSFFYLKFISCRQYIFKSCGFVLFCFYPLHQSVFWLESLNRLHLKHLLIRRDFCHFAPFSVWLLRFFLPLISSITVFFCVQLIFYSERSIPNFFLCIFSSCFLCGYHGMTWSCDQEQQTAVRVQIACIWRQVYFAHTGPYKLLLKYVHSCLPWGLCVDGRWVVAAFLRAEMCQFTTQAFSRIPSNLLLLKIVLK